MTASQTYPGDPLAFETAESASAAAAGQTIEVLCLLAPREVIRARRVAFAAFLIRNGAGKTEAIGLLRERYGCSRPTAWRSVDIAYDLVGPIDGEDKPKKERGGRL